jgi:acyl carrier protein
MTREKVLKIVIDILVDKLGLDEEEINEQSHLEDDLCMDSLDAIEVIMQLEHAWSISINDDSKEVNEIKTVSDITDYIISAI